MRNHQRQSAKYAVSDSRGNRAGISTIWMIVALPAVMTVFVLVLDIGNIWLARSELKNALDASALSGVQTWGNGGSTAQARFDANDASSANTVLGTVVALNTTQGGCANGNVSSTGEIILGTITDNGLTNVFDCSGSPSCISGTADIVFEVNTTGGDTFGNPTDPVGDGVPRRSFRLVSFVETTGIPTGLTLNSITLDLTAMMTQPSGGGANSPDDGVFDLRGIGNSDVPRGIGEPGAGAPDEPVPGLIGVNAQGVASTFAFSGGPATEPRIITVTFGGGGITSAASPGSQFFFGVDTDQVGGDIGMGAGTTVQDFGGEFGTDGGGGSGNDPFTSVGATFSANISGQTVSGTLLRISDDISRVSLSVNIVAGGTSFGVRTRKTVQVRSVCPTFLNLGLGPYNVTAESFARFVCSNGPPELVRVDSVTCVCP